MPRLFFGINAINECYCFEWEKNYLCVKLTISVEICSGKCKIRKKNLQQIKFTKIKRQISLFIHFHTLEKGAFEVVPVFISGSYSLVCMFLHCVMNLFSRPRKAITLHVMHNCVTPHAYLSLIHI